MQIAPSVKAAEWQRLSLDDPASPDWGRAVEILKDRIQKRFFPFGENWYETGGTNKLKFTSYERDLESSNDYSIFRSHIPRLGRFNAPDPLASSIANPQSLNRYAYVVNDPVNLVDPLGLQCSQSRDEQSWLCRGQIIGDGGVGGGTILWDLLDGVYVPLSWIDRLSVTGAAIGWKPDGSHGVDANGNVYRWISSQVRMCDPETGDCVTLPMSLFLVIEGQAETPRTWSRALSNFSAGAGDYLTGFCGWFSNGWRSCTQVIRDPLQRGDIVDENSTAYGAGDVTGKFVLAAAGGVALGQVSTGSTWTISNNPLLRFGPGYNEAGQRIWRIASGGRWGKGGPKLPWHGHWP